MPKFTTIGDATVGRFPQLPAKEDCGQFTTRNQRRCRAKLIIARNCPQIEVAG
jgi:hypothetical protein